MVMVMVMKSCSGGEWWWWWSEKKRRILVGWLVKVGTQVAGDLEER